MESNRSKNTQRNIVSGLLYKIITILLPFLIRTAILYIMGEQYVGLSSLFTSILQVLNLAELGFSNAIVYNMYKPIAEKNDELVCALMAFYKKVYTVIGTLIFVVGIAIMPVMPRMINGSWPNDINIYVLYVLYLVNTAVSYFMFAYKSALLNALQRIDLTNVILSAVSIIKYILQLLVLVIFKNFYLYVVVAIIASIANNILTSYISDKMFPQYKPKGNIEKETRKKIKKEISGLMIGKLSDTSRNSFDNIVLSMLFGLTVVAVYNNYYYIYSSVYGVMLIISQSMQASVGNSIASESVEKNYDDLRKFQFIYSWLVSWCTVCMLCLYQPFMKIWAGENLMLYQMDMILFCLYFYVINMNNMRNLYFTGNGLWWAGKTSFLLEAIGNLVLNFILGKIFGTTGVILATIITIFVFNFITRTNIVFNKYFKRSPKEFYIDHVIYTVVLLIVGSLSYFACDCIKWDNMIGLIVRGIICIVLPNILFLLAYIKNKQLKPAFGMVNRIIKSKDK